jgi:hypothetical protein
MDKGEIISNDVLNLARNAEIDIYQFSKEICTRTLKNVDYMESREKNLNENEAARILQNVNNLVYFSLINQENHIVNLTEFELKKTFREDISNKTINQEAIDEYCFTRLKEINEKTEEFKAIDRYIKNEYFDNLMKRNRQFLIYILKNPLLKYHSLYKEIIDKYSSLLNDN